MVPFRCNSHATLPDYRILFACPFNSMLCILLCNEFISGCAMERETGWSPSRQPRFARFEPYAGPMLRILLCNESLSGCAMERETGFGPATSTLARWHSTTESLPHFLCALIIYQTSAILATTFLSKLTIFKLLPIFACREEELQTFQAYLCLTVRLHCLLHCLCILQAMLANFLCLQY